MSERLVCRGSPRRLLLLAVTALIAAGSLAEPAGASSTNAADVVPLLHVTSRSSSCGAPQTMGTPSGSTAVIKKDGNDTVSAEVSLKNVFPRTTFEIVLTVTPSCVSATGTVTTNDQGNGNDHVSSSKTSRDTGAYVAIFGSATPGGSGFQQTANHLFGTK